MICPPRRDDQIPLDIEQLADAKRWIWSSSSSLAESLRSF
jgi:hypothetical protein